MTGFAGPDDEQRYQAAISKDARFDGVFFIAVTSTGIYCRPSCPAITPKREHMRFYRTAAAAQEGGFRACKRCRPDASPGSPEWNIRADVVGRAMRLIADGVVDRDGVSGLADRLGYEQRQVRRLVTAELGAGPLAIARAQRAQTARVLTETTTLPLSEIAFAAGFTSIRQFNSTVQEVFAMTPTQLREARDRAARGGRAGAGDGGARGEARPRETTGRHRGGHAAGSPGGSGGAEPSRRVGRAVPPGHLGAAAVSAADRPGPHARLPGRPRHSRRGIGG